LESITAKLDSALESGDAGLQATNQLSTDLEAHMGKVWQRLDHQLESLTKQLAEKAEENGMVSTLYKRKDAECEGHMKELTALRKTVEKQADQIHELETNLVALDAAQDENEETIRRLEAAGTEAAQVREELKSKEAALAELQSKLDAKERNYASELQNYSSSVQRLAQAIQDKDQSSGIAAQRAAETARREARLELESANAKREELLRETQQQRDSLVKQVEDLKRQVHEKEQIESRDAATIRSLRESLATEEAKGKLATENLAQRSANSKELESQLSSKAKDLEAELEAAKARAVQLEGESQRQVARSQVLLAGLKQWADQEGFVINNLDTLGDGSKSPEEVAATLARALRQHSSSRRSETVTPEAHSGDLLLPGENSKFFSGTQLPQSEPGNRTHDDPLINPSISAALRERTGPEASAESPAGNDPLPYASTLHHMRRVVVRSPANVPNEPAAPSIDQEKLRRREAVQPKSIMKRVTRSTSSMLKQEVSDAAAGHGAFKRSRHDEALPESSATDTQAGRAAGARAAPAPGAQATGSVSGAFSTRPSKRRRSETERPDNSVSSSGSASQGLKRQPSRLSGVPQTQVPFSEDGAPVSGQQDGINRHHYDQSSIINNSQGNKPVPVRMSRRSSGVGTQNLSRKPSVSTTHVLGPRQSNVRTYGSQRTGAEPSTADGYTDSRFSLRSQPQSQSQSQSRYWPRPKEEESQESMTFSQRVGGDENLLLPFQA
jgi:hypothetical protein